MMYNAFFELTEKPFSLTPDTHFYVNQASHRDALNTLLTSLAYNEGFVKIVGEVGTGKTLLCRKLLSSLDKRFIACYIPNPFLTPDELKLFIAQEIGVEIHDQIAAYQLMHLIYEKLISLASEGLQLVVIIDEAQTMPRDTMEALRLLTNLETEKRKLLQIVLFGQPELDEVLQRSDLRQLKQRIVFSQTLQPLSRSDVAEYIRYRLQHAGSRGTVFNQAAIKNLTKVSGGVPRLINILAHKALILAFGRGERTVTAKVVNLAAKDMELTVRSPWFFTPWLWPFYAAFMAGVLVLVPFWLRGGL